MSLEVATFYTQFQLGPVGTRAHVQVCGTTPCMLRGSEGLMKVCKSKIHDHPFERNAEGTLSWEEVECLGACVNAPMVMIGKDTYEDLTPERLEEIIDTFNDRRWGEHQARPADRPSFFLARRRSDDASGAGSRSRRLPRRRPCGDAVSLPPSEAGRPKSGDAETNPALKTPHTAPKAAAKNVKDVEAAPLPAPAEKPARAAAAPAVSKPALTDKNPPVGIEKPTAPDDLKLISGVGPKIEAICERTRHLHLRAGRRLEEG